MQLTYANGVYTAQFHVKGIVSTYEGSVLKLKVLLARWCHKVTPYVDATRFTQLYGNLEVRADDGGGTSHHHYPG